MQHFPWRLALLATGIGLFLAQCAPGDASSSDSPDARGYQAALQADGRYLVQLVGETMGTTYRVRYFQPGGQTPVNYKPAVDSVLQAFNACLNTYDPQSTLSLWNADSSGLQVPFKDACGRWAKRLHRISMELYEASNGAFDPTVMPLVRYWGFFTEDPFGGSASVDSSTIDSLLDFVGYAQKLQAFDSSTVSQWVWEKQHAGVTLDFNAVAKGLGVDVVAEFLLDQKLQNLLVEIGGEVRAHGRNASGGPWRIALEKPESGQRAFHAVLNLSNAAMATSGNYRRFWEKDGVRYGHSLNPKTGYPEKSRLLSATVVSADCATSDAWATACMVMGLEKAVAVLEDDPAVEGYLMYLDAEGTLSAIQSTGFGTMVGSVEPIDP